MLNMRVKDEYAIKHCIEGKIQIVLCNGFRANQPFQIPAKPDKPDSFLMITKYACIYCTCFHSSEKLSHVCGALLHICLYTTCFDGWFIIRMDDSLLSWFMGFAVTSVLETDRLLRNILTRWNVYIYAIIISTCLVTFHSRKCWYSMKVDNSNALSFTFYQLS